jgi:hypothetical protein
LIEVKDNAFLKSIQENHQTISFSGVGAHHQNGIAEKRIGDLQRRATTLLLHAQRRWPDAIEQAPFGLTIYPVPLEIYSWLICLLRNQPSKTPWCQEPVRSKLWLGKDTSLTSDPSGSQMMNTSRISMHPKSTAFWEHSLMPSDRIDLILQKLILTNPNTVGPPSNASQRYWQKKNQNMNHQQYMFLQKQKGNSSQRSKPGKSINCIHHI